MTKRCSGGLRSDANRWRPVSDVLRAPPRGGVRWLLRQCFCVSVHVGRCDFRMRIGSGFGLEGVVAVVVVVWFDDDAQRTIVYSWSGN